MKNLRIIFYSLLFLGFLSCNKNYNTNDAIHSDVSKVIIGDWSCTDVNYIGIGNQNFFPFSDGAWYKNITYTFSANTVVAFNSENNQKEIANYSLTGDNVLVYKTSPIITKKVKVINNNLIELISESNIMKLERRPHQ
jgi:hypothetical protein